MTHTPAEPSAEDLREARDILPTSQYMADYEANVRGVAIALAAARRSRETLPPEVAELVRAAEPFLREADCLPPHIPDSDRVRHFLDLAASDFRRLSAAFANLWKPEQMSIPSRVEYIIGTDVHGRRTKLICERLYNSQDAWSIVSAPVNQRDGGEQIHSLTRDQLFELGRIADAVRQSPRDIGAAIRRLQSRSDAVAEVAEAAEKAVELLAIHVGVGTTGDQIRNRLDAALSRLKASEGGER